VRSDRLALGQPLLPFVRRQAGRHVGYESRRLGAKRSDERVRRLGQDLEAVLELPSTLEVLVRRVCLEPLGSRVEDEVRVRREALLEATFCERATSRSSATRVSCADPPLQC
jgi:hypothetical protein